MIHRLLIAENKQVFFWVTCMLRIFSFSSKTENSVISRLGEKSSDKIRAPWIFVQIRNLNINLFDVLRSLEISFSTRCCCRTHYCATGGHRGWWSMDMLGSIWRSWDPFPLCTPTFGEYECAVNNNPNILHSKLTWDLSSSEIAHLVIICQQKRSFTFLKWAKYHWAQFWRETGAQERKNT